MLSNRRYLEKLEARTTVLLTDSDDRPAEMQELAQAATEGGLILDEAIPRRSSPQQFAIDLFSANPAALDLVNAKVRFGEMPPHPDRFESLGEIASALRPNPN